jgi:hypothetical protein
MSLEASNFKKAQVANMEFGKVSPTLTTTFELRLFSDIVDLEGVGTELTNTGYVPLQFTNNLTNFPSTTDGIKLNAVAFSMATLGEDSDEVVSLGIFDADTDELLYRKVFTTPFVIASGNFYNIAIGELRFAVTSI